MLAAIVFLGVTSLVTAKLDTIGDCSKTVQTDQSMSYTKFAAENGGKWSFVKVPNTKETADYGSMYLEVTKNKAGVYITTIYYTVCKAGKCGSPQLFVSEETFDEGTGHVTTKAVINKTTVEFKIFFMKYVEKRYAYYYICSSEGGNEKVDYRYVLANSALTDTEKADIAALDTQYGFKGQLKDLSL